MSEREEVQLERGYVLHQRAYKNSSQLVDCLTEGHGLVTLVAQGSRRLASGRRAMLQPFLPLRLSWLRRGELGRLTHVEFCHPLPVLSGKSLLAGYYLNELLIRLTARGDANSDVFSCYSRCLEDLDSSAGKSRALRLFELRLLRGLGYALELDRDVVTGEPLTPDLMYRYEAERGPSLGSGAGYGDEQYSGRDLISLRDEVLDDDQALRSAKRLLSRLLRFYLGDRPLKTRTVLMEILGRGLAL